MEDASDRGPARYPNGRFGPGHTGRPRGSRNKISRRVALSILRHFEANDAEILKKLTDWQMIPDYMRLLGKMLPSDVEDEGEEEAPDLEPRPPEG
jgi:hypothetical protein